MGLQRDEPTISLHAYYPAVYMRGATNRQITKAIPVTFCDDVRSFTISAFLNHTMGSQHIFSFVSSVSQNISDFSLGKRYWLHGQEIAFSDERGHTLPSSPRANKISIPQQLYEYLLYDVSRYDFVFHPLIKMTKFGPAPYSHHPVLGDHRTSVSFAGGESRAHLSQHISCGPGFHGLRSIPGVLSGSPPHRFASPMPPIP